MENFNSIEIKAGDLMRRCEKQYTPQFTGFLTPEEQVVVQKLSKSYPDVFVIFAGGFCGAERCIAAFFPRDIYVLPENDEQRHELEEYAEMEFVEIAGSGFVNI